jgi:transposase
MRKNTPIELSAAQRERLEQFTNSGKALARHIKHAQVLLKLAEGWSNQQIALAFDLTPKTVITIRQRFHHEGVEAVLRDKPRPGAPKKITGEDKALVVALACSNPPEGHAKWTLHLLADKMVELEVIETISPSSVGRILKKTS